jgi:hypothetical protein
MAAQEKRKRRGSKEQGNFNWKRRYGTASDIIARTKDPSLSPPFFGVAHQYPKKPSPARNICLPIKTRKGEREKKKKEKKR